VRRKKKREEKPKKERKKQVRFKLFTISIQLMKPFCQTFFEKPPNPSEEPLHQKSQSRSRFQWSRSPPNKPK
jgi:hypothetical protein